MVLYIIRKDCCILIQNCPKQYAKMLSDLTKCTKFEVFPHQEKVHIKLTLYEKCTVQNSPFELLLEEMNDIKQFMINCPLFKKKIIRK